MKKILALITACTLVFSCFSCDEKKQDENSSEEISETVVTTDTADTSEIISETPETGNTVVESGFRELSEADFKSINVSLTYPDKEAPVTMTKYELPDYDFGERLSPCKQTEDPSVYDPVQYSMGSDYNTEKSTYMKAIDTPEKGTVSKACKRGNKIYMWVNYDHFCMFCHEWALFCYDMDTKETKEIYTYSDSDFHSHYLNTLLLSNKLVVSCYQYIHGSVTEDRKIDVIDLESGESEELYHSSNITSINTNGTDTIWLMTLQQTATETNTNITEYNLETGEKKELGSREGNIVAGFFTICDVQAYIRNSYKDGYQIVTDFYTISTDAIGNNQLWNTNRYSINDILYASEKKLIIEEDSMFINSEDTDEITEGNDEITERKTVIHTYDLEKMEHYITEVTGDGYTFSSYNGDIVMYQLHNIDKSDIYYINPELGLAYKVNEDIHHVVMYNMSKYCNSLEINEAEAEKLKNADHVIEYPKTSALWIMEDKQ